ncbi:carboxymuconolactone decarboxylase family protein [Psychroflexus halocasei]|uniref:Alkylhydroperoxidase AhpD family core domain-containing protein n=1 Tax=Psychroflexus halocasei TaxID=908615 RepID=A0A1H3YA59_9FLAO|nr:carboxymuconolactone decarboxylase family protein [Psychroflexus halocasei]SEA08450.1 alkylhydroperoxidase AhpD family core domain-containing protein [Psychroflexus halocasei]
MQTTKKASLAESVIKRDEFKRKFSLRELYLSLIFIPRAIIELVRNKKNNLVDEKFIKRLQLAVTEVNGCAACSYQHTQMALKQGMSNEEINTFLSGGNEFTKPNEAKAIMFAQHFADARGIPKSYAYDTIVKEYGQKKAKIILSSVQIMLAGNIYGIPFSAFLSRLQGQPYKKSSLFYELGMLITGIIFLPIAIIHGLLRGLWGLPNRKFNK